MLKDLLNITTAYVHSETETNDGMGGVTTTVTSTLIPLCAIYQTNSQDKYVSDKVLKESTHVLVTLPEYYTWPLSAMTVTCNSSTYKITGRPDDVMGLNEMIVVGLERQT